MKTCKFLVNKKTLYNVGEGCALWPRVRRNTFSSFLFRAKTTKTTDFARFHVSSLHAKFESPIKNAIDKKKVTRKDILPLLEYKEMRKVVYKYRSQLISQRKIMVRNHSFKKKKKGM